ncbi:Nuclear transcription factor Y subunit B [Quillaja saponaria]|uniref:Nuclear transcription factor Y subunit B n=1 Tax=Quillaja saponaria TaxID=32244 RepID=A0AAD7LMM8_QUISA|nr:Nuclear transcription factor Y subunit B [Quillaja saponaria]
MENKCVNGGLHATVNNEKATCSSGKHFYSHPLISFMDSVAINNTAGGAGDGGEEEGGGVLEQDLYMPIANVIRIMRPHVRIADEAKELMQECVSEFISFITGEANQRCQQQQRKTITTLTVFLNRYRETQNGTSRAWDPSFLRRMSVMDSYGNPNNVPLPMPTPTPTTTPFPPSFQVAPNPAGMFPLVNLNGGNYRMDGSPSGGQSRSSSAQGNDLKSFDPSAYKLL